MKPITHELADFSLGVTFDQLPAGARKEAVRAFTNWVGCAVGGSNSPIADAAVRGSMSYNNGTGSALLLGRSERLDVPDSALINCLSSCLQTFDDTHLKTITHPTGPVASALLALSGTQQISGNDLLLSLTIGMEITCRISTAIKGSAHTGWYMTGMSGGIGTAAAVGRVLKLSHDQLVSAVGLAATQACGFRATHGSMAIAYVPALAARNGLSAAFLARSGFTCTDIAIDGRYGLLDVVASKANVEAIAHDLSSLSEFQGISYKPYPCGIVIHPAIEACLQIVARAAPRTVEIERVDVQVSQSALDLTWRKLPSTSLEAQVSLYHWISAALIFGKAGLEQGEDQAVQNRQVRELQTRIFVESRATLGADAAVVAVKMKNGSVYSAQIDHVIGSIARPMTDAGIDEKFLSLASRVMDVPRARALLKLCRNIECQDDVHEISRAGATVPSGVV